LIPAEKMVNIIHWCWTARFSAKGWMHLSVMSCITNIIGFQKLP